MRTQLGSLSSLATLVLQAAYHGFFSPLPCAFIFMAAFLYLMGLAVTLGFFALVGLELSQPHGAGGVAF